MRSAVATARVARTGSDTGSIGESNSEVVRLRAVFQHLETGATELVEVPVSAAPVGGILVRSRRSLVSAGTERMLVSFGRGNYLQKAMQQPERVREVLEKVQVDGLLPTYDAVRSKLEQPIPLGYCNVGVVEDVGDGVTDLRVGDRVLSNGGHSEYVAVPRNLTARIPDGVDDDDAAFGVIGSIALQGIRLAEPTLGEHFVVTGLGMVGLLAVQLLLANGCRVLGIDTNPVRCALARTFGSETVDLSCGEDPLAAALDFSGGQGVDAVLLCASTASDEPVHQAAQMSRKRGRIVLTGVTGLQLSRQDFYEKELSFSVSCSYGPGRYDPVYEQQGIDYPIGHVRWTERRNFEAVLDLMARGRLDPKPFVTHRFDFAEAPAAYDLIMGEEPSLGVLLQYAEPDEGEQPSPVLVTADASPNRTALSSLTSAQAASVDFIGAGNHSVRALMPAFSAAGARFGTIVSKGGASAAFGARKFGFQHAAVDAEYALEKSGSQAVVVASRHDTHAGFVERALRAGKHVFVEKPLCLTLAELDAIEALMRELDAQGTAPILMAGFNRRFSPLVAELMTSLEASPGVRSIVITVNAGAIPGDHWTQDPVVGGGRIIGEACHFVDLARQLAGAPIVSHHCILAAGAERDTASIHLSFADGSIGSVNYCALGHRSFPKERVEVFTKGRVHQIDNFRRLSTFGARRPSQRLWLGQDKGHSACAAAFLRAVEEGGGPPIALTELFEVMRTTIELAESC